MYASPELQEDREVLLNAVKNGLSLIHLSSKFRADKEVVLMAANDSMSLSYASRELQSDKEVVLKYVQNFGSIVLQDISDELKTDKDIIAAAELKDNLLREELDDLEEGGVDLKIQKVAPYGTTFYVSFSKKLRS